MNITKIAKEKKLLILLSMLSGLLILVFVSVLTVFYKVAVVNPTKPNPVFTLIKPTATPTPDPDAPFSILMMGYGGGNHEGGLLTDTMIVTRINPRDKEIKLISIPRDIWVPIPVNGDETMDFKINAAYAIGNDDRGYPNKKIEFTGKGGGGELAKSVVSKVVGFKIDYFVALDFIGFIKIVDVLGGIDVSVQKTFDDPMYPIETDIIDNCGNTDEEIAALTATMSGEKLEKEFSCRYEALHFDKGIQHMDGQTALKYTRSRHSPTDGGDFNRALRQRQVIFAVKNKIISIGFVTKIIPMINALKGNLLTDIDMSKMVELISKYGELAESEIRSINLTDKNVLVDSISDNRQFILIPKAGIGNWIEVHQYIDNPDVLTSTPEQ